MLALLSSTLIKKCDMNSIREVSHEIPPTESISKLHETLRICTPKIFRSCTYKVLTMYVDSDSQWSWLQHPVAL
jgi:hypothetical protein